MDIEAAVKLVNKLIVSQTGKHLDDLPTAILRGSLEGKTFSQIAESYPCNESYAKEVGSNLFKQLSVALGVKTGKKNIRSVLEERLYLEEQKSEQLSAPDIPLYEDEGKASDSSRVQGLNDKVPCFFGREAAITHLNNLVNQGEKIIVIQAAGGVGKTTLAQEYVKILSFDLVLELPMAKETENITAVESVIEEWLKQDFQEEPGREFGVTLERLKRQLQTRKVGILIDNLEPALDKQGSFVAPHRRYVELLRVLAAPTVQSVTLITSRNHLSDDGVNVEHYLLPGLDEQAWRNFYHTCKVNIDDTTLTAMHKAYGGNAKAMDILCGAIREDFDGDMAAYWRENSTVSLVETELKNLVSSQFKRLQELDIEAYKLLCRLGCYRYQDVPKVPTEALLCLLWDIPEDTQRRSTIKSLRNRCLVEFNKGEYWLHPMIREEAIERLKTSREWEEVNRKTANFWTESVKTVETIENAKRAFEAYFHYVAIADFEMAGEVINIGRDNKFEKGESLGHSFYRLGLLKYIDIFIKQIIDMVETEFTICKLYNILGNVNWIKGNFNDAIYFHTKSGYIAIETIKNNSKIEFQIKLEFERMYLIYIFNKCLCKLDLWEIDEALNDFYQMALSCQTHMNKLEDDERYYSIAPRLICADLQRNSAVYIAFINSYLGNKKEALEFIEKSNPFDMHLDFWSQGYSLLYIGSTYKNLGNTHNAFQMYNQAIRFAEESNYTQVKAKALTGLAELYRKQANFEIALSKHLVSIELFDKIGAKCDLAEAYYQLGLTYQNMGEVDESQTNFNEAIRLFIEMEAPKQVEKVKQAEVWESHPGT